VGGEGKSQPLVALLQQMVDMTDGASSTNVWCIVAILQQMTDSCPHFNRLWIQLMVYLAPMHDT
jgi:hypothetical protein